MRIRNDLLFKSRDLFLIYKSMSSKNQSKVVAKKTDKKPEFSAKNYERPGLSTDEIEEIKEAFDIFDQNGEGSIQVSDLLAAMKNLGFDSKNPSIYRMIADFDETNDGIIEFDDFLDMMTARISEKNTKEDLKRVFNLFDEDRSGEIKIEHLKKVAKELGEDISEEELKEIIQRADLDGDSKLTFEDFFNVMTRKSFA